MNAIVAQLKKHASITLLALVIIAFTPMQAMEQPKDLIQAAKDGDLERVKELIAAKVDVNEKDNEGHTALMMAAQEGHLEVVKALLNAQANIDLQDNTGFTALMRAIWEAEEGYLDVVKTLINAQANIDLQDETGFTALMRAIWAAEEGYLNVVKALLTEISSKDAEKIKNNFTGLLALNRMRRMPKDIRKLITQKLIQELVDQRIERTNASLQITSENGLTARAIALRNKDQIAALLDPTNAESQQKLRAIIRNNILRILFGEPKKKEKTVEPDDPFGRWDEE